MCDTCGCTVTKGNQHLIASGGKLDKASNGTASIEIMENLLHANNHEAAHNREHFNKHGVLALNLMSSPGSGKTSLLEATIDQLKDKYSIAVIEGDLETENDAARIRAKGVPAIQITTGNACHLDAHMVHKTLHQLDLTDLDIVFIENVGNLVCPASFDLGHHLNVTLLSVTEGDDKPSKYPVMFRGSDITLITKADLLSVIDDFDPAKAKDNVRALANMNEIFELSAKPGKLDIDTWTNWIDRQVALHKKGEPLTPAMQPDGIALHSAD